MASGRFASAWQVSRRVGRRIAWPGFVVALLLTVVFVGVLPARTYLDKRDEVRAASDQLATLEATNAAMTERLDRLDTDEEIERIAREEYGLVMPGEEVYRVLPEQRDPIAVPDTWPFEQLRRRLGATPPPEDDPPPSTTSTTDLAPVPSPH